LHLAGLETWAFDTPKGQVTIKTSGHFRTDHEEALRDACVDGLGITVSSIWSAYKHLQRGELVQVLEDYPLVSDTAIWAVYPSSRLLAPKVRAFIDYFGSIMVVRLIGIELTDSDAQDLLQRVTAHIYSPNHLNPSLLLHHWYV